MKLFLAWTAATLLSATLAHAELVDATPEDNELVKNTMAGLVTETARHYCLKDGMTCRSIYTLKDKVTGQPVDAFYVTFFSSERQVSSAEYALPQECDSVFNLYTDFAFDGVTKIEKVKTDEKVVKGKNGTITFKDTRLNKLGTTRYILADLVFKNRIAYLAGFEYDDTDSTVKIPVRIDYPRIK